MDNKDLSNVLVADCVQIDQKITTLLKAWYSVKNLYR